MESSHHGEAVVVGRLGSLQRGAMEMEEDVGMLTHSTPSEVQNLIGLEKAGSKERHADDPGTSHHLGRKLDLLYKVLACGLGKQD